MADQQPDRLAEIRARMTAWRSTNKPLPPGIPAADIDWLLTEVDGLRADLVVWDELRSTWQLRYHDARRERDEARAAFVVFRDAWRTGWRQGRATTIEQQRGTAPTPRPRPLSEVFAEVEGTPSACGACGIPERGHWQRWADGPGVHGWIQPSDAQILMRMLMRRGPERAVRWLDQRGLLDYHLGTDEWLLREDPLPRALQDAADALDRASLRTTRTAVQLAASLSTVRYLRTIRAQLGQRLDKAHAELDEARLENAKLRAKLDKASTGANLLRDKVGYWTWIASRLDDDVMEARRQRAAVVAERDALSTLLRGMARRHVTYRRATTATIADYIREGYDLHRAEIGELRTEIERLAARKWTLADLPDDAARIRDHLTAHGLDTPHGQVLCVVEGAGGLAAAYRRWAGLARRSGPWSDVVAELADVVLSAVVLAARLNIDITQAIADKIGVVNTRGWREVSGGDTTPDEGTCPECQCARPFHKTWCTDPDALAVDAPAEGGESR